MFEAILDGVFGYIGSGGALTCPIYIDDLCAGVLAALVSPDSGGEAILLTDGQKVAWKDTPTSCSPRSDRGRGRRACRNPSPSRRPGHDRGARACGRSRPAPHDVPVEQASRDYHFSNEKARALLGFEPRVFYEEGLARTASAYLEERAKAGLRLVSSGQGVEP